MDWDALFAAERTPWERGDLHPALNAWRDQAAGSVLIPGCGRAPEGLALARSGCAVTLADLSPIALDAQRAAFAAAGLAAHFLLGDVFAYTPDVPFDSLWEQTCLCAIPPKLRIEYAAAARRWLRPGGRFFALFMQTGKWGGPPYDCPIPEMRALFPDDFWIWPEAGTEHPHPKGWVEAGWVLIRR